MECPECQGEIITEGGEEVCSECGLVSNCEITSESHYINFTNTEHHERISHFQAKNPLKKKGNRARLSKYSDKRDSLTYDLIGDTNTPEHIQDTARMLANKYFRLKKRIPTTTTEYFVGGIIYLSYRICGMIPPDLHDVKYAEKIAQNMKKGGLKINANLWPDVPEYIEEICRRIERMDIKEESVKAYSTIPFNSYISKNVACACVYHALKDDKSNITPMSIADSINANSNTVRKAYKNLFSEKKVKNIPIKGRVSVSGFLSSALFSVNVARKYLSEEKSSNRK
ncbi:MAG TPA: hypothetical protein ENH28_00140 [Euryarchaeota archaeon]|nr:hypothetical protein BMS3Bbin15_01432 [archaeon BMS3Bbin15]HDL14563.1 hypothetical protein [Euryarchaeota archaeon]